MSLSKDLFDHRDEGGHEVALLGFDTVKIARTKLQSLKMRPDLTMQTLVCRYTYTYLLCMLYLVHPGLMVGNQNSAWQALADASKIF